MESADTGLLSGMPDEARSAGEPGTPAVESAAGAPPAQSPASSRYRRPIGTILAAAVLSAVLSSAGTYAVITAAFQASPASAQTPEARLASTASASASAGTTTTISEDSAIVQVAANASKSVVTITTTGMSGLSPFSVPESGPGPA